MMLLPIVERELRVAARQWRTYWGRTFFGSVALLEVLHMIWMANQLRGGGATGPLLLKVASYLALCFCLFTGANRTGDCISAEKREETLGLLFLTQLKAHDIILGKLVAASLHSLLYLVSVVPILAVPIMLGGVSGGELIRVPISLLNGLFLSLSVGILASTLAKVQRKAMLTASVAMVVLTLGFPVLGLVLKERLEMPHLATIVSIPSPLFAHEMSLTGGVGPLSANLFWIAVGLQFAMSVTAIVASCIILPRTWQVKAGYTARWNDRVKTWFLGDAEQREKRRAKLLARNPIFWLGARGRFGPALAAMFMATVLAVAAGCILYYEMPKEPAFVVLFIALATTDFYLRARVATLAASLFARERQMGTWEMILSTPMSVREIIQGNWMAVLHYLLPTYVAFLIVYPVVVWLSMIALDANAGGAWFALVFGLFSVGEFCVVGYVAMWRGMKAHNSLHAPGQALLRVTLMPWCVWMFLMPAIMETQALRDVFERNGPISFLVITALIWSVSTALAWRTARRNLLHFFREPSAAPSVLKSIKRKWTQLRRPVTAPALPLLQSAARN